MGHKDLTITLFFALFILMTLPAITLAQNIFTIPLEANAWAMISNPLQFDASLSGLSINDCQINIIVGFEPVKGWSASVIEPFNDLEKIKNTLPQSGKGFFVYNNGPSCSITSKGPPRNTM